MTMTEFEIIAALEKNDLVGFAKVGQDGGIFVTATFYNVSTKEKKTKCVRDYDYSDCSRDNDDLYYMPINKEALIQMMHDDGRILEGDKVKVVRGRKVPKGTILNVFKVGWYDTYRTKQLKRSGNSWANIKEELAGCYDEEGNKVWIKIEYLERIS